LSSDFLGQHLRIAPRLARFANIKPPKAIEVWVNKR